MLPNLAIDSGQTDIYNLRQEEEVMFLPAFVCINEPNISNAQVLNLIFTQTSEQGSMLYKILTTISKGMFFLKISALLHPCLTQPQEISSTLRATYCIYICSNPCSVPVSDAPDKLHIHRQRLLCPGWLGKVVMTLSG